MNYSPSFDIEKGKWKECKICGKKMNKFGKHLFSEHSLTLKEYYDKYIKLSSEGLCMNCGKETSFNFAKRCYNVFCSRKCSNMCNIFNFRKGVHRKDLIHTCKICSKEFYSKSKNSIYCSRKCYSLDLDKNFNSSKFCLGQKNVNPHGHGKFGFREDLNQYFRSTWEANFARILNLLGIKWEYEKNRVHLGSCSTVIDFWLPELYLNIEVKGARFGTRDRKLQLLYSQQPNFPIKVVDGEVYKTLTNMYKNSIVRWEN